jgi:hypothetical protein
MRWVEDPSPEEPEGYLGAVLRGSRRAYPYRTTTAELLGRPAAGRADVTLALNADMLAFAPPSLRHRERVDTVAGDDLAVRRGRNARSEPSGQAPANVRRADGASADPRAHRGRAGGDQPADPPPRPAQAPATQMPAPHGNAAGPAREIRPAAPVAGTVAAAPVGQVSAGRRAGQGATPAANDPNSGRQPSLSAGAHAPAGTARPAAAAPSGARSDVRHTAGSPSGPGPSADAGRPGNTPPHVVAVVAGPGQQPSRQFERVERCRDPNVAGVGADPQASMAGARAPGFADELVRRVPAEGTRDEQAPGRGRKAYPPGQRSTPPRPASPPSPVPSSGGAAVARAASSSAAFPKAVAGVPVSAPSDNPVIPRPSVETVQMPIPRKSGRPAGPSVEQTTGAAPPTAAPARGRTQRVPPAAQYVRAPRPSPPAAQWARRTQLRRLELRGRG